MRDARRLVSARVNERSVRACAAHLRDEKLEAGPLRGLVPPRDQLVIVQLLVSHPLVHAAVREGGYAEDAAAARVQRARLAVDASVAHRCALMGDSEDDPATSSRIKGTKF